MKVAAYGVARDFAETAGPKSCKDQVEVGQRRLHVDTLKWVVTKLAPRKYGDRIEHDVKGVSFQPAVLVQVGQVGGAEPKTISGTVDQDEEE
jgi:hypothetical protein